MPKPRNDRPARRSAGPWALVAAGLLALRVVAAAQEALPPSVISVAPTASDGDEYWWADRFDRVRFSFKSTSHYFVNGPVPPDSFCYLPPFPPPLGSEVPLFGTLLPTGPAAARALAPHVLDPFYPMLGAALSAGDLSRSLQAQLESYQAEKQALQEQVRASLAELADGNPSDRERELAALAASQAPRFVALENRAERLRADLQRAHPLPRHVPTDPPRREGASPDPAEPSRVETLELEADALQLAAFYQDGLTPEQRRLLRETAAEIQLEARGRPATEPEAHWLFFSPEMARVRLPAALPSRLGKNIADYSALKRALQDELRGVLRNRSLTGEARLEALQQLAATEAPRLTAVEALAEDIRRGLAGLPQAPGLAVAPALPADLATRISAYRRHKVEALKTLHALLTDEKKGPVAEFNRAQTALAEQLNRENAEIRLAVGEYVRSTGQPGDRKSIDDLLREFEGARQQQESQARFRDYRAAVLQPGLSPGQRRVLFDGAVVQLALPLPAGQKLH